MRSFKLNAEEIYQRAARESGLAEYSDPAIEERFSHLMSLFNDFGSIPEQFYPAAVAQIETVVVKRLKVARDWRLFPEILEQEIKQPLFVVGNPRAGTTFTQSILALDDGARTPHVRDVQHPSPPRGLDPAADAAALAEQDAYVDYILAKSPQLLQTHPYFDQRGEMEAEDEYTYSLDFDLLYLYWFLHVPTVCLPPAPRDPVVALQFFKNMLKQYQWKTPTKRWVGKGVIHHYIMPAMLEVFPDAVHFWIHRPPEEYIGSLLAHLEPQFAPFNEGLYRLDHGAMVEQIKAGVDYILKSPATYDSRIHHIRFKDFVVNPAAVIAPIYEERGIPFTNSFAQRIKDRMNDPKHRADRYGKFTYSIEKFGLDRPTLRKMFAEYCDRFEI